MSARTARVPEAVPATCPVALAVVAVLAGGRRGGEQIGGGGPPAEGIGIGRAQGVGHAGELQARAFDFTGPIELGAEPLGARGEDGRGKPSAEVAPSRSA